MNEFSPEPDRWVCIMMGVGDKAFSAGNDLKYQAEHDSTVLRDLGLQR